MFESKTNQQSIVRQLDALQDETQKLETVYQKKIADLEELKKSVLQKAFSSELTQKSRRDDNIVENELLTITNPEGVK
jgi:type I restriction enzyme S subunit